MVPLFLMFLFTKVNFFSIPENWCFHSDNRPSKSTKAFDCKEGLLLFRVNVDSDTDGAQMFTSFLKSI